MRANIATVDHTFHLTPTHLTRYPTQPYLRLYPYLSLDVHPYPLTRSFNSPLSNPPPPPPAGAMRTNTAAVGEAAERVVGAALVAQVTD